MNIPLIVSLSHTRSSSVVTLLVESRKIESEENND
jgi:hypothetical protein